MMSKTAGRVRGVVVAAAVAMVGVACKPSSPAGSGSGAARAGEHQTITVSGSSALVPLVTEAANRYMRAHANVSIQVSAGGSRQGLAQVASGAVTIGNSDVFASGPQAAGLEDHKVAVVAFATMANKGPFNQAVTSLTQEQLRGIFTGAIHDWSAVGGAAQPLTVINRARNSGTRAVFGSIVLGGDNFVEGSAEQDNSGQLQSMLLAQVGSISYLSLSYRSDQLQVFNYNGVAPTPENIESGAYPIWSYEHMYTHGPAAGEVRAFIDFINSPAFQDDVVPRMNFVPVSRMHVQRDHD